MAATRSIASRAQSRLLTLTFDINQLPSPRNWAMAGGSNGYRVALVRRQLTPGLISSLPGTAGLPPFISFSTSYPELPPILRRCKGAHRRCHEKLRLPPSVRPTDGVSATFEMVGFRCVLFNTFPTSVQCHRNIRGDKTAFELFLSGIRALALRASIIDVVRIASRFSSATGGH